MAETAEDPSGRTGAGPSPAGGSRRGGDALFAATVADSENVIALLDPDATFRYVSPLVGKVLGRRPEDLIGRSLFDLIHPDDVAAVHRRLALSPAEFDVSPSVALRLQRADGGWRHVEVAGANRIDDEVVAGFIVNIRDLTESRAQTEALRQQRDLFEAVINSAASLVLVTDSVGRVVRYNRA